MSEDTPLEIPFLDYLGMSRDIVAPGLCHTSIEPKPEHFNSMHMAHGGIVMTLLDAAMGNAARSVVDENESVVTIDMQVAFIAPARGRLSGEGRVVKATRTLIFAEGTVKDEAGELVAKATGLFRPVDRARMRAGSGKA